MDIEITFRLYVTMGDAESFFLEENKYELLLENVKDVLKDKQDDIFVGTTVSLKQLSSTGLEIHCPKGSVQSEQSFSCSMSYKLKLFQFGIKYDKNVIRKTCIFC